MLDDRDEFTNEPQIDRWTWDPPFWATLKVIWLLICRGPEYFED